MSQKSRCWQFLSHFRLFFNKFSVAKTLHFTQKGVPAVSNFCRRSMFLQSCVKKMAQTMFRKDGLQSLKQFCRFAGFCGTVCKTMSFSLTASEFVCSFTPAFCFCLAQFFLYRIRYFCTFTSILFCIFTLLNTVAVILPLIFTAKSHRLCKHGVAFNKFVLKGKQSYFSFDACVFCFVYFCAFAFDGERILEQGIFEKAGFGKFRKVVSYSRRAVFVALKSIVATFFVVFEKTGVFKCRVAICFGLLLATTKILFTQEIEM